MIILRSRCKSNNIRRKKSYYKTSTLENNRNYFFFRSVLISFSSISSHRSDIAFVNRYNRIFHILRAPRKIFSRIVRTRTSTSSGFISVFTNRNRDKSKQNNSNKFTFLLVKIFAKEKKNSILIFLGSMKNDYIDDYIIRKVRVYLRKRLIFFSRSIGETKHA